ncbi:AMP-binding protein [Bacillus sp. APMAM]|nr:AMP-binding protein [Bacillus sp. APMAM]RTZ54195.1 NrsF [Bacillus sp. SAJ1]
MMETLIEMIHEASLLKEKGITFINAADKEKFVSYNMVYEKALKLLYHFQERGLNPGDEVIFQIEDNEIFVYTFWACILGGLIPIPVSVGNNTEHKLKLFRIWDILNNPYLITSSKNLSNLEKFSVEASYETEMLVISSRTICIEDTANSHSFGNIHNPSSKDIAFVQFSSGTTGDPKGVILTHKNVLTNLKALINAWGITEKDSSLSWMPLTHDMGLIAIHLTSMLAKNNQYIIPTFLFIRRPTLWMLKANEHRVTQLYSPNFGYKFFLDYYDPKASENWDLSCIRLIANGAEPISTTLCYQFLEELSKYGLRFETMNTVYGLAEATVGVSIPEVNQPFVPVVVERSSIGVGQKVIEVNGGSNSVTFVEVGRPIEDCEVRICNEDDKILPEGTVGYIHINGKNVTSGFYNNPSATKKAIKKGGWLNTGDLGFMRNGRLVITGRAKDIIIINGQNYYAHDIERVVENIHSIGLGNVAVCGVFDEKKGQEDIIVFIRIKKSSVVFSDVDLAVRKEINRQLGLEVLHVIPVRKMLKTTSGKIQRFKMRELYLESLQPN